MNPEDSAVGTMRASVLRTDRTVAVEKRPLPVPDCDQVLVRIEAVGVCGSDVHYYRHGRIGDHIVDGPIVLGHEAAGIIVEVGSDVDPARTGQRVSIEPQRSCRVCQWCKRGEYNLCPQIEFYATPPVDGVFAEYGLIQADFAHPIPESLSMASGALLEPLSCAIAAVRKARVQPGSSVLIAGCGPIGIICAQAARAFGAREIVMTDLLQERRRLASGFGATRVVDPAAERLADASVDAFIDATGALPAVRAGITAVKPGGCAVLVGMGDDDMNLPVSTITAREINLTGIFRYNNTWPAAIAMVESGIVDLDSLVTGRFGLAETQHALDIDTDPGVLKSIVEPQR